MYQWWWVANVFANVFANAFEWKGKCRNWVQNDFLFNQMYEKTCILQHFCIKVRAPGAPINVTVPCRIKAFGMNWSTHENNLITMEQWTIGSPGRAHFLWQTLAFYMVFQHQLYKKHCILQEKGRKARAPGATINIAVPCRIDVSGWIDQHVKIT